VGYRGISINDDLACLTHILNRAALKKQPGVLYYLIIIDL